MRKGWSLETADRKTILRILLIALALLAILTTGYFWIGPMLYKSNQADEPRGDLGDRYAEAPAVEFKGAFYRPYKSLTSILVIGVDEYSTATGAGIPYRNNVQADYLLLLVINDDTETVTQIQIDRDTMAKIAILSALGNEAGTRITQICLSHGIGDGKEQSCLLTQKAVSWLLLGIDIDYYISMQMDGISALNDALGGVTVTLADDFTSLDPIMANGTTITLHGIQAEYYVRSRMNIGIGTNEARMIRQQVFMNELSQLISQRIQDDDSADFIGDLLDSLDPYLLTDMKRAQIIKEVWKAKDYVRSDIIHPAGDYVLGEDGFTEFHADETALEDLVIETFYYPVESTQTSKIVTTKRINMV